MDFVGGTLSHFSLRGCLGILCGATVFPMSPEEEQPVNSDPSQATAVLAVGMSIAVWWPSFTLGAWGILFFDQKLAVWTAATAALLVVLFHRRGGRNRLGRVVALLVPTLWLVLAIFVRAEGNFLNPLIDGLGVTVAFLGIPATIWVLARIIWPEFGEDLMPSRRAVVIASVAFIAVASFLLGANQAAFLTCEDFSISGNSEPPGCRPEAPSPSRNP
jgi:hypothetical protein